MFCLFKALEFIKMFIFSLQRLVSFLTDLRGADNLLQKAIKKVDGSKKIDTAQVEYTVPVHSVTVCDGPGQTC